MEEKKQSNSSSDKSYFLNAPIVESPSHKVVIVLDKSPKFGEPVPAADLTFTVRDDQNAPITGKMRKILWNCSMEAIMEFHRVVEDLFPQGHKQMRFVTSDFIGKFLTEPWSDKLITKEELMTTLRNCELPQASGDASSCSVLPGILFAMQAIGERTPLQRTALYKYREYLAKRDREQPVEKRRYYRPNVAEIVRHQTDDYDTNEPTAQETSTSTSNSSNVQQQQRQFPLASSSRPVKTNESRSREEGEITDQIAAGAIVSNTMEDVDLRATLPMAACVNGVKKPETTKTAIKLETGKPPAKKAVKSASASSFRLKNHGTIVVVTSIESSADYDAINEYLAEQIAACNHAVRTTTDRKLLRIEHVDLYVLNILPSIDAKKPVLTGEKKRQLYTSRLISVTAGGNLVSGVHKILHDIYDLVSTTVVGIPMKEEAQSEKGQSTNYDVEMLHPKRAHLSLLEAGILNPASSKLLDTPSTHGGLFSSVRLKWCTATVKLKSEMFPLLLESFPITPAQVHNRASVCLAGFLQAGKNVMLEVPPDAYQADQKQQQKQEDGQSQLSSLRPNLMNKLISHYMSQEISTGQVIIHRVAMGEKATLDGKLCSDKVYGPEKSSAQLASVLNLRTMTQIVQATQIKPIPIPLERQKIVERLLKDGRDENGDKNGVEKEDEKDYTDQFELLGELLADQMPFRLVDTFIYNIPEKFEPILSLIHKPDLKTDQYEQCCAAVHVLVTDRSNPNKEPLTDKKFDCQLFQTHTTAGSTKDEQYRVAFEELGRLFQRFSGLSSAHQKLLDIFVEATGVRPPIQHQRTAVKMAKKRPLERTKLPSVQDEEQQMNEEIKRRKHQLATLWMPGEEIDLYEWWHSNYEKKYWSNWKGDFEGRKKYGDQAQECLYPNLKLPLPQGQSKGAGTGTAGPIE